MTRMMVFVFTTALMLAACGGEKPAPGNEAAGSSPVAALALGAEPAGVRDVVEVKKDARVGDEVVVFGRVRKFSEGYASFVLTDRAMKHCAERENDSCPTPWDYCCEPAEDLAAHSINVEFRDGERPFREKLDGVAGLALLKDVVVRGKIASVQGDNVIVAAEGFFIRP